MWLPTYCLYVIIVFSIRIYKWFELHVIRLLFPYFRGRMDYMMDKVGVVFHKPGEYEKWTQEDEQRALAKCKRYDSLLHMKIKDDSFYWRACNLGTLGAGDCFIEGVWDYIHSSNDLTEMARRVMKENLMRMYWHPWNRLLEWIELCAFNLQTKPRSFHVIHDHYAIGDDLFEKMLGEEWMIYTCAYWAEAKTLEEAQINKMDLIARKLKLKPGMRLLDIGCGWGGMTKYLAQKYGVETVGITICQQHVEYGYRMCKGLPCEFRMMDYRDLDEKFDRIISVGMMEHVGFRNYETYFTTVRRCLKDNGMFLLHCIGRNHDIIPRSDPFAHKYIFPNGNLPHPTDITKHTRGKFVIEDWHNFGPDYGRTLEAWRVNLDKAWPELRKTYPEKIYRMWILYMSMSIGMFQDRKLQLWQIVLSKDGIRPEYRSVR